MSIDIGPNIRNSAAIARAKTQNLSEEDKGKLKKAAFDFQSLLINQMLQSMRETKFDDEEDSGFGYGKDIMTGMFDMQLSSVVSNTGSFGIAEMIYESMTGEKFSQETIKSIDQFEGIRNTRRPEKTSPTEINVDKKNVPNSNEINKSNLLKYNNINVFDVVNKYNFEIESHSDTYNVDPHLVKAIIAAESSGISDAVSPAKAKGLMQLIDSTAKSMGVKNIFNPSDNIKGGTKYIKSLMDRYNGDIQLALAAYNAGPGAVDKYNGIPPYKETQNYVNKVLNYYSTIKAKEQELAINE
jgi:Rod binding domain-containing protein